MEKKTINVIVTLFVASFVFNAQGKVENTLKGSLDSIPSPSTSLKIRIMGGKVCLRCKRQNIAWHCQQTLKTKIHHPAMFCLITSSKLRQ